MKENSQRLRSRKEKSKSIIAVLSLLALNKYNNILHLKAEMYHKRMEELETGLAILSSKNKFEQEKGKLIGTLGVMFTK